MQNKTWKMQKIYFTWADCNQIYETKCTHLTFMYVETNRIHYAYFSLQILESSIKNNTYLCKSCSMHKREKKGRGLGGGGRRAEKDN